MRKRECNKYDDNPTLYINNFEYLLNKGVVGINVTAPFLISDIFSYFAEKSLS